MTINNYTQFASADTKISLVIDVLEKAPLVAIKALHELITDDSSNQKVFKEFSKLYNEDKLLPNEAKYEKFNDVYLVSLKSSFEKVKANQAHYQYKNFLVDYKLNQSVTNNINYLITYTESLEHKDRVLWLESIITHVNVSSLEDAIKLNEKSVNILNSHFKFMSDEIVFHYLAKTNAYSELKSIINPNLFNKNSHAYLIDLEDDDVYEDTSDYSLSIQLILLTLKFNSLDKELIEKAIHMHDESCAYVIESVLNKNLLTFTINANEKFFMCPQQIEEKVKLLEDILEFDYIGYCQDQINQKIKHLKEMFQSNTEIKTIENFLNYYKQKVGNNAHLLRDESLISDLDFVYGMCEFKKENKDFLLTLLSVSQMGMKTDKSNLLIAYQRLLNDNPAYISQTFSSYNAKRQDKDSDELVKEILINLETMILEDKLTSTPTINKANKIKL